MNYLDILTGIVLGLMLFILGLMVITDGVFWLCFNILSLCALLILFRWIIDEYDDIGEEKE